VESWVVSISIPYLWSFSRLSILWYF
jgi:hypothetical protein